MSICSWHWNKKYNLFYWNAINTRIINAQRSIPMFSRWHKRIWDGTKHQLVKAEKFDLHEKVIRVIFKSIGNKKSAQRWKTQYNDCTEIEREVLKRYIFSPDWNDPRRSRIYSYFSMCRAPYLRSVLSKIVWYETNVGWELWFITFLNQNLAPSIEHEYRFILCFFVQDCVYGSFYRFFILFRFHHCFEMIKKQNGRQELCKIHKREAFLCQLGSSHQFLISTVYY